MSNRRPMVRPSRRRGVVRLDVEALMSARVQRLTHLEYRVLTLIWVTVARHGEHGEVPRDWLLDAQFGRLRLTKRMLVRFVEHGLLEEWVYDDGDEVIQVADWRTIRPVDLTSAERKRRYRRRLYGANYYGTEGEVQEVRRETADDIAMLEAEGRAFAEGFAAGRQLSGGAASADPHPELQASRSSAPGSTTRS